MRIIDRISVLAALVVTSTCGVAAQQLTYDVGFETYFDNREFSPTEWLRERSGTEFAARIAPSVGLKFAKHNSLNFGVDAVAEFTNSEERRLFESVDLELYYGYDSDVCSASAGIFPIERMAVDSYSTAFFADDYLFSNNLIKGVMGRREWGESFVEGVVDWVSQPSADSREIFRLLSAGRKYWSKAYVGYNLSLTHFAGQDAEWMGGVVDNALVNPVVGIRLVGDYEFDGHVGYLQSLQRDRSYSNDWLAPGMVDFGFRVSRWGVTLEENAYIGDDLAPLYGGHVAEDGTVIEYGGRLYTGDQCFRAADGFYNRASVGYGRCFGALSVDVKFVTHYVDGGLSTEQLLSLRVNLNGSLYNK